MRLQKKTAFGSALTKVSSWKVHMATRSRKGYWRVSANSLVQRALNNRWLHAQGLPDMRTVWIVLHYGPQARV
jgi:hypothetical protein